MVHIPRSGGSTVHSYLLESSKDFFSGVHHSAVSLSCNPNKFKYITSIRNPIDRVHSSYTIQKKFRKLPFHIHAKEGLEFYLMTSTGVLDEFKRTGAYPEMLENAHFDTYLGPFLGSSC